MGAVGNGLLVDGGAQHLGEAGRLRKSVARRHLVPAHDDRALGPEETRGEPGKGLVPGTAGRVHPGGGAQVDGRRPVEDVAGEGDEHRPGRRGERDLGRPPDDAREVLDSVHLDRPLDERLGDGDEGVVEEGLGETVPDLLLPRRHQHRRAPELRVVERSHRVPEPGRDVHVAGREPSARPRVAVRHRDHDPFLEAEHVAHVRLAAQGVHDGKLGGARVAEQAVDPLVAKQRQEGGPPRDEVPARGGGIGRFERHSVPPGMVGYFTQPVRGSTNGDGRNATIGLRMGERRLGAFPHGPIVSPSSAATSGAVRRNPMAEAASPPRPPFRKERSGTLGADLLRQCRRDELVERNTVPPSAALGRGLQRRGQVEGHAGLHGGSHRVILSKMSRGVARRPTARLSANGDRPRRAPQNRARRGPRRRIVAVAHALRRGGPAGTGAGAASKLPALSRSGRAGVEPHRRIRAARERGMLRCSSSATRDELGWR